MMQALNAAISSSCGLGAVSAPSSSQGSSATILWLRAMRSPAKVKPSTTDSLRVWPVQRVVTLNATLPFDASFSIASTVSPRAARSRPFTRGSLTVSSIVCSFLVGDGWSGEDRRRLGDARRGARGDGRERRLKALVHQAGADEGPARRLMLLRLDRLAVVELAPDRRLQRVEVEPGLRREAVVEEAADLEELVHRAVDFFFGAALGQRVDDQRIELGVLRFLDPVMPQQALEQGVDVA